MRYTVTEKALLIIVDGLKEFRTISLSQRIRIYNRRKNLICKLLIWIDQ